MIEHGRMASYIILASQTVVVPPRHHGGFCFKGSRALNRSNYEFFRGFLRKSKLVEACFLSNPNSYRRNK